jgi:hypothetical protein
MNWSRFLALPSFSLHNSLCSYADDPQIKLAISFALAQSTKLSVLEERTRVLGRHLSRLPVFMAETGEVPISEKQIMQVCVCRGSGWCVQQVAVERSGSGWCACAGVCGWGMGWQPWVWRRVMLLLKGVPSTSLQHAWQTHVTGLPPLLTH